MSDQETPPTLTFRCPPELEGVIPPPVPAAQGLPDWIKAMPSQAFDTLTEGEVPTVKRCPPFIDAMRCGFLIPLLCDLRVENGEFRWDNDLPAGGDAAFVRSPLGFHPSAQVSGTPLFQDGRFLVKFHNLWTIEAPEGYALLFTHPVNRFDLPFTTLTGLVDADHYHDSWIHFPAHWHDENFNGVLPRGTPIAQCVPVKRQDWALRTGTLTQEEAERVQDLTNAVSKKTGIYRSQFRA